MELMLTTSSLDENHFHLLAWRDFYVTTGKLIIQQFLIAREHAAVCQTVGTMVTVEQSICWDVKCEVQTLKDRTSATSKNKHLLGLILAP